MKTFRWVFHECDPAGAANLATALRIPPLLARCLMHRGCSEPETASRFLNPKLAGLSDPFLLPGMERAVERLLVAHERKERFVIFGDYDVDGVTATAVLASFFEALGWDSVQYLPHRLEEGYGLTRDAVENCLTRFEVRLIVAVDCGSTSCEVIRELGARGIDVIVLDHHQIAAPLPECHALVNPRLLSSDEHLKDLCSAGLAFKLAHALLKRCRALGWPAAHAADLRELLDLVALGTVADIVPLVAENRVFVRAGLERIAQTKRPGLRALIQVAGLSRGIGAHEIAFQLAPRLNAAGRLESALEALELLLTTDSARAESLARTLDERNRERQGIEQNILDEVLAAVRARFDPARDFAIIEGNPDWHLGVVGIVASRVLREFHRPVIIFGGDGSEHWRGSGRSIEGFDLARGLRECADLLVKHGGHAMAAGVTLASARVDEFRKRFNDLVSSAVDPEALQPALKLDSEVALGEMTFPLLKALEAFRPLGQGNPPVQLAARNLAVRGEPRRLGSEGQHLRFAVTDGQCGCQAVWWNCGEFHFPERFDLAFTPELNEFNGSCGIQLKVLDLRASMGASA